jgi:phage-related protein
MPSVAEGVEELRLKDREGAYRVFYLASFADAVVIFHAFTKKTQRTPLRDIAVARKRLKEMLYEES